MQFIRNFVGNFGITKTLFTNLLTNNQRKPYNMLKQSSLIMKGDFYMLQTERYNQIMAILKERKNITVKELCHILYASPATIRRDLEILERRGLLTRSYGGAVLNETFPSQVPLSVRTSNNQPEKRKIAAKAASFIKPGETIFMDASSTTYFMVPYLSNIPDITVITNNPNISLALAEYKIRNFCTGGEMLNDSIAFAGNHAEKFVRGIRADWVFFSSRGFDGDVMTDSSKSERDIKCAMLECAKKKVYLCDKHKNGKTYSYVITDVLNTDYIIRVTDETGD